MESQPEYLKFANRFSNYFKGLPHFNETRMKLLTMFDVPELIKMDSIADKCVDIDDSQQTDDYSYFQY